MKRVRHVLAIAGALLLGVAVTPLLIVLVACVVVVLAFVTLYEELSR